MSQRLTTNRFERRRAEERIMAHGSQAARSWLEKFRQEHPDDGLEPAPGAEADAEADERQEINTITGVEVPNGSEGRTEPQSPEEPKDDGKDFMDTIGGLL